MKGNALQPVGREAEWRDECTWYTHETALLHFIKFVGRRVTRPLATVECIGFENIPQSGPCILASNHINNLDVIFYGAHLPRHIFAMGKIELFKIPLLGWALRLGGAFPVYRGERDQWALEQAGRVLTAGQMLFIFPEGTRGGPGAQLRQGKTGTVKLALQHRVPIIPAAILGTHNFRLKWSLNNHIRMEVGQPLDVTAMAGAPPYEYETLRDLTKLLMHRIAAMLPPAHRGVYQ